MTVIGCAHELIPRMQSRSATLVQPHLGGRLDRIGRLRLWSEASTPGPPAALVRTNRLTVEALRHHSVSVGAFLDGIWTGRSQNPLAATYPAGPHRWANGAAPPILWQNVGDEPANCRIEGLPYVEGSSSGERASIDAIALPNECGLRVSTDGSVEIWLRAALPETLLISIVGRPLREVLSHPLLDGHDLKTIGASRWKQTSRVAIDAGDLSPVRFIVAGMTLHPATEAGRPIIRDLLCKRPSPMSPTPASPSCSD